jgi:hypothetical protein
MTPSARRSLSLPKMVTMLVLVPQYQMVPVPVLTLKHVKTKREVLNPQRQHLFRPACAVF